MLLWSTLFAKVVLRHMVLFLSNAHTHIMLPDLTSITRDKHSSFDVVNIVPANAADDLRLFIVIFLLLWLGFVGFFRGFALGGCFRLGCGLSF